MAHFQFENLVNEATRLDRPVERGPLMRWERKALEQSVGNLSLDTSGRPPMHKSKSSSGLAARTPSKLGHRGSVGFLTPGRGSISRAPSLDSVMNGSKSASATPSSMRPRKSSCKTPKSAAGDLAYPQGDRFIPNRSTTDLENSHFALMQKRDSEDEQAAGTPVLKEYQQVVKDTLNVAPTDSRILSYQGKTLKAQEGHMNNLKVLYSCVPTSVKSSSARQVPKQPEHILDAPDIIDDYYLNLLSWSSSNLIAIGLDKGAYLWNAETGDISVGPMLQTENEYISSVSWIGEGSILAVGNSLGQVQLYDAQHEKLLRTMTGHAARVGSLAWNGHVVTSGSRSGAIHHHDVRVPEHHVGSLLVHSQEVCGLQWSPNGRLLASGANDNQLCIWDAEMNHEKQPVFTFTEHQAAVKALAWCPWQSSLLVSGGGTADRSIKFWNINTGTCINSIDAKSQVCSLLWSEAYKELVSGHGFKQFQVTLWKYPSMNVVANLTGHTARILALALSPDGSTVASLAGDETLQLWNCFPPPKKERKSKSEKSKSDVMTKCIR